MAKSDLISIAVEGVIGVGKTSLALAMAEQMDAHLLSEEALHNPFLGRFYRDRARWALACQLQFLDQRLQQFAAPRPAGKPVIADHTIEKELLFAQVVMEVEEYAIYERYFKRLAVGCAFHPQVVVYLIAEASTLIQRISERGRDMEGAIDLTYLQQLQHNYQGWFMARQGDSQRRIVVVDADGSFIARDPAALSRVIEACRQAPPGVSYCNPIG